MKFKIRDIIKSFNSKEVLNRISTLFSGLALIYISIYVLLNSGLSFDGAFHTQSAINYFKYSQFTLDYGDNSYIQTKVPFQIVNGFFFSLFGQNFIVANFANIFFFVLLWFFVLKLAKKYENPFLNIAFVIIAFNPFAIDLGFKGFGELPSLTLALWGLYCCTFANKKRYYLIGGLLLGTAIATKWIIILAIVPLTIFIINQIFIKNYKSIVLILAGVFLSLLFFWQIEYAYNDTSISRVFNSAVNQSNGYSSESKNTYGYRLSQFWNSFVLYSGGAMLAKTKIIALSLLLILIFKDTIILTRNYLKKIKVTPHKLFFFQIAIFALTYSLWWFLLGTKPWYRRYFNADILLFISLFIIICSNIFKKKMLNLIFKLIFSVLITLLYNSVSVFSKKHTNGNFTSNASAISQEMLMRKGLNLLPKDYNAYGYGWWQAPRWSFLAKKQFNNAGLDIERLRMANNDKRSFIFFGAENHIDKNGYEKIHNTYELKEIYSCHYGKIKEIIGINAKYCKSKILPYIDYSKINYTLTQGLHGNIEKGEYKWGTYNSTMILKRGKRNQFYAKFSVPSFEKMQNDITCAIMFEGKIVYKVNIKNTEINEVLFDVNESWTANDMVVSILFTGIPKEYRSNKNTMFRLYKIGFVETENIISFIDYSEGDETISNGLFQLESSGLKWSSTESAFKLHSANKTSFYTKLKIPNTNLFKNNLTVNIYFNGKKIHSQKFDKRGIQEVSFQIPNKYRNKLINIVLKSSESFNVDKDPRNLSFAIYKIGFK